MLFTDRKATAPLFKSLSKTYKNKLVFGEVKKEPELQKKFGIEKLPALIVVTDPYKYEGEQYNMEGIKIDQLSKFLSQYAVSESTTEKPKALNHLTYASAKNPKRGLCGKETSNLCVILFLNGKGYALIDYYTPLVEKFASDPVSLQYVFTNQE